MKIKKRVFDLIFIIISASILVIFSEYDFLEKNMASSFIPILIAYYLGQYSHLWFKNNCKTLLNKIEFFKFWVIIYPQVLT